MLAAAKGMRIIRAANVPATIVQNQGIPVATWSASKPHTESPAGDHDVRPATAGSEYCDTAFSVSGDTLDSMSTRELDASDATPASGGTTEEASEMVAEAVSTASDAGDKAAVSSGSASEVEGVEGAGAGFEDHNERLRVLPGKAAIPCRSECGRRRCDDY